jgi:hypothetical protein
MNKHFYIQELPRHNAYIDEFNDLESSKKTLETCVPQAFLGRKHNFCKQVTGEKFTITYLSSSYTKPSPILSCKIKYADKILQDNVYPLPLIITPNADVDDFDPNNTNHIIYDELIKNL